MKFTARIILILLIQLGIYTPRVISQNKTLFTSIDEVIESYESEVIEMLSDLDAKQFRLSKTKRSFKKKAIREATVNLINHYYEIANKRIRHRKIPNNKLQTILIAAENHINGKFGKYRDEFYEQDSIDNHINWLYLGPINALSFGHNVNRHIFLKNLIFAYVETKEIKYIDWFNKILQDWLINNPPPNKNSSEVNWRTLEAGIRLFEAWPQLFYLNDDKSGISQATKLLMLLSIREHALHIKKRHEKLNNHALMQMNGLANISKYWPEFNFSKTNEQYAIEIMKRELDFQVLPDGTQNELASDYHYLTLKNFERFSSVLNRNDSIRFADRLREMYQYLAYSMSPNGYGLNNNDSDRTYMRGRLGYYARKTNHSVIRYITSNGKIGTKPDKTSLIYPFAGHAFLRDGFKPMDHWLYFDIGPYGNSHQHNDKLHISITAFGKDFLVDGGRYYYKADKWRQYFKGSFAHNILIVDQNNQNRNSKIAKDPITSFSLSDSLDIVRGSFKEGYMNVDDSIKHTRTILYKKSKYWIVKDVVEAQKLHEYNFLWHFHPKRDVFVDSLKSFTDEKDGNLLIMPLFVSEGDISVEHVRGRLDKNMDEKLNPWSTRPLENFLVQGWYSDDYNKIEESSTIIYKVSGKMIEINWLIFPFTSKITEIQLDEVYSKEDINSILFNSKIINDN